MVSGSAGRVLSVVLVASVAVGAGVLPAPSVAAAPRAAASGSPCPGPTGVTVVVDATPLGGGVRVGCAPGAPADGLDALRSAGFAVRGTTRFPGFVCRIDGAPAQDPCLDTAPPDAYWSYWHAPRGGAWTYSDTGAAERTPPAGSVEGWVFSDGSGRSPTLAPPARPTPTTTVAPVPPPPAPTAAVAGETTVPAPPGPARVAGPVPGASDPAVTAPGASGPAPPAPAVDAAAGATTTPGAPPVDTPSSASPGAATTGSSATGSARTGDVDEGPDDLAAGVVVDPDDGSTGSPWATALGLLVVAAVAGGAVVAVRRRRATEGR